MTCEKRTCFLIRKKKVFLQTSNAQLNNSKVPFACSLYLFLSLSFFFLFRFENAFLFKIFQLRNCFFFKHDMYSCSWAMSKPQTSTLSQTNESATLSKLDAKMYRNLCIFRKVDFRRTSFYCIFAFDLKIVSVLRVFSLLYP